MQHDRINHQLIFEDYEIEQLGCLPVQLEVELFELYRIAVLKYESNKQQIDELTDNLETVDDKLEKRRATDEIRLTEVKNALLNQTIEQLRVLGEELEPNMFPGSK